MPNLRSGVRISALVRPASASYSLHGTIAPRLPGGFAEIGIATTKGIAVLRCVADGSIVTIAALVVVTGPRPVCVDASGVMELLLAVAGKPGSSIFCGPVQPIKRMRRQPSKKAWRRCESGSSIGKCLVVVGQKGETTLGRLALQKESGNA